MNTPQQLKDLIVANGSKFLGVEFIKKDGSTRTLSGHMRAVAGHDGANTVGHLPQYITLVLAQKDDKGREQFRNVDTSAITALNIGGKRIVVK